MLKKNLFFLAMFFLIFSCEESEIVNESGSLTISNIQLPELNEGFRYGSWLLLNGTFVNVANFNMSNSTGGNADVMANNIDISDLAAADAFAITVEPSTGANAPSNYVLLVGDFIGDTAMLTLNNTTSAGISTIAVNATAAFTVQSPTTPTNTSDERNGVWFFSRANDVNTTTLDLNYPSDVFYQAWLRTNFTDGNTYNLNLGTISANFGADNSNLFITQTMNIPEFSGEDFFGSPSNITFPDGLLPLDVAGNELILTAIPNGFTSSESPFAIELFTATIPTNPTTGSAQENVQEMHLNNESYSVTVTR